MSGALFPVVLAGGRGTRFWPRSRRAHPKQFLTLGGRESLLAATVARTRGLAPLARTLVVTTADLAAPVRRHLPGLPKANLILEPSGRNTAPAVGLAALAALGRDADPILLVLPSDHLVRDTKAFARAVRAGLALLRDEDRLITFGVRPTRPETGYGYIRVERGASRRRGVPLPVARFIEKPPAAVARRLVRTPGTYWNAGIFLFRATAYLEALRRRAPRLAGTLARLAPDLGRPAAAARVARAYRRITPVSVDTAVMEKEHRLSVIPVEMGWSDLGSWASLAEALPRDKNGNLVLGRHVGIGTRDSVLVAPGKLVATIGVQGLIVVDTGDVLLVCPSDRAQEVRDLVALVMARGGARLT